MLTSRCSLQLLDYKGRVEHPVILHLEAFGWDSPRHIPPRYTEAEPEEDLGPIRERIQVAPEGKRTAASLSQSSRGQRRPPI
jgi:hypothetical protein